MLIIKNHGNTTVHTLTQVNTPSQNVLRRYGYTAQDSICLDIH